MTIDPASTPSPAPDVTTRPAVDWLPGDVGRLMTGTGRSPTGARGTADPARPGSPAESGDVVLISAPAELADGDHGTGIADTGSLTDEVPEPVYEAVEDWVTGYFLPMFRRTLGGEFRWCAQWWQHAEAISRLTALWHAWEVLRLQPGTGIGIWYRDHLDHQLPILMGARGPFYQCSESAHREPHEAIAIPAPDDWWEVGQAEPDADDEWWDEPNEPEPGWDGPTEPDSDEPAGTGSGWYGPAGAEPSLDEPGSKADLDEPGSAEPSRDQLVGTESGATQGGGHSDGAAASPPLV